MNFFLKHIVIICCLCATAARSQEWVAVGGGANLHVRGIYSDTVNHLLYVVGSFSSIGGQSANRVAVWNGTEWNSLCDFGSVPDNSPIIHITMFQNEIIVSGQQYRMANEICPFISKYNGTSWEPFGTPNSLGRINIVDNEIYAIGSFENIGGNSIKRLARWNGTNWEEAFENNIQWNDIANSTISQIIKYKENFIIAGNFELGDFKEIAQWNGFNWLPLQNGVFGDAIVNIMAVYEDILYVGGHFTKVSGNPDDYMMAWDGEQWFDPFPNITFIDQIKDIQVIDGDLYIVGLFQLEGDDKIHAFARFDGDNFCAFGGDLYYPNLTDPQRITGLDGKIYTVCNKVLFNDTVNYIAQWNGTEMDTCVYMPMHAGISEIENAKNLLSAYPNPGSESVTVSWQATSGNKAQLMVTDQLGKTINSIAFNTTPGENKYIIDLTALANGIYFVRITGGTEIQTCKIIKK